MAYNNSAFHFWKYFIRLQNTECFLVFRKIAREYFQRDVVLPCGTRGASAARPAGRAEPQRRGLRDARSLSGEACERRDNSSTRPVAGVAAVIINARFTSMRVASRLSKLTVSLAEAGVRQPTDSVAHRKFI